MESDYLLYFNHDDTQTNFSNVNLLIQSRERFTHHLTRPCSFSWHLLVKFFLSCTSWIMYTFFEFGRVFFYFHTFSRTLQSNKNSTKHMGSIEFIILFCKYSLSFSWNSVKCLTVKILSLKLFLMSRHFLIVDLCISRTATKRIFKQLVYWH